MVVLVLIGINEMCFGLVIMLYLCCNFRKKEDLYTAIVYIVNNTRSCKVYLPINEMREESDWTNCIYSTLIVYTKCYGRSLLCLCYKLRNTQVFSGTISEIQEIQGIIYVNVEIYYNHKNTYRSWIFITNSSTHISCNSYLLGYLLFLFLVFGRYRVDILSNQNLLLLTVLYCISLLFLPI